MRARAGVVLALAFVVAACTSAPAGATVTCSYDSGIGLLSVGMDTAGDAAILSLAGGDILVNGATCAGGGTVTNTTNVRVDDNSAGGTTVGIVDPAQFAPGAGGGEDAVPEIEFLLNLGAGLDLVDLEAGTTASRIHVGTGGVNVNGVAGDADVDLQPFGSMAERFEIAGSPADDVLSAQGGAALGVGGPFATGTVTIEGRGGNDTIEGGNGGLGSSGDSLSGTNGNDTVRGFGAKDTVFPGVGDDVYDGGAGSEDRIDYSAVQGGITIDLASNVQPAHPIVGADSLAGFEEVIGTGAADTLSGGPGGESLQSGNGDDLLNGRGGSDGLTAGNGSDTVTYLDAPAAVSVDLGAGTVTGGSGNDFVSDVENVVGSPFDDTLTGSALANSIAGLGGADRISALAGPDVVDVRDGEADTASCGTEIDTAIADRASVDAIDPDCESVQLAPEPEPEPEGGGQPPAPDLDVVFDLAGKAKQKVVKQKGVVVTASCPLEDCAVDFAGKVKARSEELAASAAERLKLKLKRAKLRAIAKALRAGKKPRVKVAASVADAAGNAATETLTVRAKP